MKIKFTYSDFEDLRRHIIRDDDKNEWAAFGLIERDSSFPNSLYVRKLILIEKEGYNVQTPSFNGLQPEILINLINEFKESKEAGFLEIHSHPFCNYADFSFIDNINYPDFRKDILRRKEGSFMVRMVYGRAENGFTCLYYDKENNTEIKVDQINVIGRNIFKKIHSFNSDYNLWLKKNNTNEKYLRNIQVFGKESQDKINDLLIGCIGAGGIMNPFINMAKHVGISKFIIADPDNVEEINFNRLLGVSQSDIGTHKTEVLKRELRKFEPNIKVVTYEKEFDSPEVQYAFKMADIIVCGVDNNETRLSAQILAAKYMIPLFDMGSGIFLNKDKSDISQKGSQLRIYIPGSPCIICQGMDISKIQNPSYTKAREMAGYINETNESPGSVITLNCTISSITLATIIDYITGKNNIPLHISFDEKNYSMKNHNFSIREDCPICGLNGVMGKGKDKIKMKHGLTEIPFANSINN